MLRGMRARKFQPEKIYFEESGILRKEPKKMAIYTIQDNCHKKLQTDEVLFKCSTFPSSFCPQYHAASSEAVDGAIV